MTTFDCIKNPHTTLETALHTLAIDPHNRNAHGAASACYLTLGDDDKAERHALRAVKYGGDYRAVFNLAMARLRKGDLERGFKGYEVRIGSPLQSSPRPALGVPKWDGRSKGLVAVWCEQGLGDSIQMMRYGPEVERLSGKKPLLLCSDNLKAFTASTGNWVFEGDVEFDAPIMSLPYLTHKYSIPPLPSAMKPRNAIPPRRVAICWAGNKNHAGDRWRSMAWKQFFPILEDAGGIEFVNVCKERDESHFPMVATGDMLDTARLLETCDLLITCDTAMAHLAGTIGLRTFVMLSVSADWRWQSAGNTTSLYPSITLFRQKHLGDWHPVVAAVKAELYGTNPKSEFTRT